MAHIEGYSENMKDKTNHFCSGWGSINKIMIFGMDANIYMAENAYKNQLSLYIL